MLLYAQIAAVILEVTMIVSTFFILRKAYREFRADSSRSRSEEGHES